MAARPDFPAAPIWQGKPPPGRTMLDRVLASLKGKTSGLERVRPVLFADSAVSRIAAEIREHPERLATALPFVRPPFPFMWLESSGTRWEERKPPHLRDGSVDPVVASWVICDEVFVVAEGADACVLSPISYRLLAVPAPSVPHPGVDTIPLIEVLPVGRELLEAFLWGRSVASGLRPSDRAALIDFVEPRISESFAHAAVRIGAADKVGEMLSMMAGDAAIIMAKLAVLSCQPRGFDSAEVARSRVMTRLGPKMQAAHTVVSIDPDRPSARPFSRPRGPVHERHSPRWHEVRGHWCSNGAARGLTGCDHDGGKAWIETAPGRMFCPRCRGKRWWRTLPKGRGGGAAITQTRIVL